MAGTFLRRHSAQLLAAAALLGVYLIACRVMPTDVFWHPDEGAKFLAMQSIRWERGLTYAVPYPGRTLDPNWAFYPGRCDHGELYPFPEAEGGVHLHWPIWFPLLSRVFFALFGIGGIYVVPLVSGWLTGVVAGRWLIPDGTSGTRAAATVLVGCASPLMFYSLCFSEHTLATLLGTLAVASLITSSRGRRSIAWAVVPLLFASVVLRLEMAALVAALIVAWAVSGLAARSWSVPGEQSWQQEGGRGRVRVLYAAAFGVVLIGIVVFGRVLTPRHWALLHALLNVSPEVLSRSRFLFQGVVNIFFGPPEFETRLPAWVWNVLLFTSMAGAGAAPFVRSRRVEALLLVPALLVLFEASLLMVLASHAYLNRQGIVAVAPYVILAPFALADAWRRRDQRLFALAVCALCYAAIGFGMLFLTRVANNGTYLIGLDGAARYMLTIYPLGAALALTAVRAYRRSDRNSLLKSTVTILTAGLMAVSVLYQIRGVEMLYTNRTKLTVWQRALERQGPVVTDVWWLAAALAPYFTAHELYCVASAEELRNWVAAAAEHGVANFTFASRDPVTADKFPPREVGASPKGEQRVDHLYLRRFSVGTHNRLGNEPP
jgi:hypothetical protein